MVVELSGVTVKRGRNLLVSENSHFCRLKSLGLWCLICVVLMSGELDPDLLFGMASGSGNVKILSYAGEGVPIARSDVQAYQSQLVAVRQQASSQVIKPLIGLLSSVDNPASMSDPGMGAPVSRGFGLSDEGGSSSVQVAGVDRFEIEKIIQQLTFDAEPVQRAWATQQQQSAETGNFYNYGLNAHLLREYVAAQVALRIERSRRVKITGPTGVAGNRDSASMRPQQHHMHHPMPQMAPPVQHVPDDPWRV